MRLLYIIIFAVVALLLLALLAVAIFLAIFIPIICVKKSKAKKALASTTPTDAASENTATPDTAEN